MPNLVWPLILSLCLPMTVSAKKYAPARWIQFADAGFTDLDLQSLPKETIHVGKTAAANRKALKSKKPAKKKSRRSSRAAKKSDGGSPLSLRYNF
jgi:hypothetical protein